MVKRKLISKRGMSLPTPIHRTFEETLELGTSLGEDFCSGLVVASAKLEANMQDWDNRNYHLAPHSLLVGDLTLQVVVDAAASFIASISNIELSVMKVPQDYDDDGAMDLTFRHEFITNHPEWVFCTKYIGKPSDSSVGQQYQPVVLRSRKRMRLFQGDRLVIVASGHLSGVAGAIKISGVLQGRSRLD
jgi:hypothetical protein